MEQGSFQNSVPTYVDKSVVLSVKPLRTLTPYFPSPPQAPPLYCSTPFGPFPPGYTPFFPYSIPEQNQQETTRGRPANNQEWGSPFGQPAQSDPEASNGETGSSSMKGKSFIGRQKKVAKKTVIGRRAGFSFSVDGGKGTSSDFLIRCRSFQREDGNREMIDYTLMTYDALRRRLSQVDDAKEAPTGSIRRPDLKAGNILMSKGVRTNMRKRIGDVPGVEIGDIFFFRFEMLLVGLHVQSMGGIDSLIDKIGAAAVSIVSSGGYDDDVEDKDVLIYSGQGGMNNKDKKAADQKLERGNLALEQSLHRANEIRVIRGMKDSVNPLMKVYVYDGLYTIKQSWLEKGKSGCNVFKYKLVRIPGQPSAFSVWQSVQNWKNGLSSRAGLILPDITSGAEKIPVSLVNDVDGERVGPAYFTYSSMLKYSKPFKVLQPSFGCNCHKACQPGDLNCSCIRNNGGDFPYIANGILVCRTPLLHECGPTCPCFPNCKNRVSQSGLKVHMEVFKTTDRGWGLRSWDPIRTGTFICEYAGEVIESSRVMQGADEEENDDYVFDTSRTFDKSYKWNYEPTLLDEEIPDESMQNDKIPSPLIISAKNVGNVARFMNHSCSPNVFWQPVLYEHNNESFLHIAFFAMKHIPPMTELTYDYGITEFETHRKRTCLCGSAKCRGYFG